MLDVLPALLPSGSCTASSSVVISAEPAAMNTAPWTLTGPGGYSQSGTGDLAVYYLTPGDYTLTWGDVSGWVKPSPPSSTQTLAFGGTITFTGTYSRGSADPGHTAYPELRVCGARLFQGVDPGGEEHRDSDIDGRGERIIPLQHHIGGELHPGAERNPDGCRTLHGAVTGRTAEGFTRFHGRRRYHDPSDRDQQESRPPLADAAAGIE